MSAVSSDRSLVGDEAIESLLERAPDDYTRVELLVTTARQLQRQQPQRAAAYAQRALELSQQRDYAKGVADARFVLGYTEYLSENFERAIEQIEAALTVYDQLGQWEDVATAASSLAGSYYHMARYDKALLYLWRALEVCQQHNDTKGAAAIHSNIASIYQAIGQLDLALEHYLKSLQLKEERGNEFGIALSANNIASVYYQLGHYETALNYTEQALAWLGHHGHFDEYVSTLENLGRILLDLQRNDEALERLTDALHRAYSAGSERHVAMAIFLIGRAHMQRGDLPTALSHYAMALAIFRRLDSDSDVLEVLRTIARSYRDSGSHKRSLRYYKQAIEIARRTNARLTEAELCDDVSRILEQLGHFQTALAFFRRSTELRRQVLAEDTEKLIAVMEVRQKIEREAREKEIFRLRNVELANALSQLQEKTAALEEAYSELEQQQRITAEINTQLQQANERLQALDRERTELLSIVTHDLKNLVASIKLSAEVLRHPKTASKPDVIQKTIERILDVTERMQHLIASLLDVSALESGKLTIHLQPVAAHAVAGSLIERYQNHADSKRIALLSSIEPAWVVADPIRLEEVYDNLVSNAIKYTPPGGEVRILLARRDQVVRFVVSDTGPGFSDEDKKKLFSKFQRLSARPTGGESSTGLGLAIAKKLVDLMNGRIWLDSALGEGAMFYVELPAAEPPQSRE
ncbi:MAG: tetratricopeptide repeat-containing sensor histidine kinase [Chlorobi bacterium]|nr:tetratricopeptide repeat-containing sensor histidine kinase [Chlorobiota bacterium]